MKRIVGHLMHPYFLSGVTAVLVGFLNFFARSLLKEGLSPFEVCATRESVTALVFGVALLLMDRSAFKVRLKDLWVFILFAFFNVASNVSLFAAQEMLPLEVAAALEMTEPYFIMVFAFFLFGIRITKRNILASLIMFLGCLLITGYVGGSGDNPIVGVALGLFSGITLAAFTLASKYTETRDISVNTSMFYFFFFSALMVLPFADYNAISTAVSSDIIVPTYIVGLGVFGTLLPNYITIFATRHGDPAVISIIITASIVASTAFGVFAFGDDFGWSDVFGIILVMIAITVLDPPERDKKGVQEEGPS